MDQFEMLASTSSFVTLIDERSILIGKLTNFDKTNKESLTNILFDVKRLLGKRSDDALIQNDALYWPFTLTNKSSMAAFEITKKSKDSMIITAEQILAMQLKKMLDDIPMFASKFCRPSAVVTTSSQYGSEEKAALKSALSTAGIHMQGILSDTTAVLIGRYCRSQQNMLPTAVKYALVLFFLP